MDSLQNDASVLQAELDQALERIGFEKLDAEETSLHKAMEAPDFWQDTDRAQTISKQQSKLERRLKPWRDLRQDAIDLVEMIGLGDDTLQEDLSLQLDDLYARFVRLKEELKLS